MRSGILQVSLPSLQCSSIRMGLLMNVRANAEFLGQSPFTKSPKIPAAVQYFRSKLPYFLYLTTHWSGWMGHTGHRLILQVTDQLMAVSFPCPSV
ncbi:MAG: hypothetical protein HC852_19625 [Acaryochloridaceae cyanobacterium RU_4_10]|nr:hypothetical protein [Acaryochloridaceae cyanobacterium RU_4_10]